MPLELITRVDTFELIRDKVAQLVADGVADQVAQAGAAADQYRVRVYTERATPWGDWLYPDSEDVDPAPFVNIYFDSDSVERTASSLVATQACLGLFNLDCYGLGVATDTSTGHQAADEQAAREVQRAARLVRAIIMAGENTYLGLDRALVTERAIVRRGSLPPSKEATQQRVAVMRLVLQVRYAELAPQVAAVNSELLHIELKRDTDGRVLSVLDYAYTP